MPFSTILAAALAVAAPTTETAINTHDPKMFEQQLREMGYNIDPFELNGETASTYANIDNGKFGIVLGGCTKSTACTYVVLVGAFDDVIKPPIDWVTKMNGDYDLIKVWTRDSDNALSYSAGAILDGVPRTNFRLWFDKVRESGNDLAAEAVKAKLVKE